MKSPITTHVLDIALGKPAAGVPVTLEMRVSASSWKDLGKGVTDSHGRLETLLSPGDKVEAGIYRMTFDSGSYFKSRTIHGFYPAISIEFEIRAPQEHHHVPLLLSPFGYSTYRGA